MKKIMSWLKNEESGQGMVEYGLIIVLIAIAVAVVLPSLATAINGVFNDASDTLNGIS